VASGGSSSAPPQGVPPAAIPPRVPGPRQGRGPALSPMASHGTVAAAAASRAAAVKAAAPETTYAAAAENKAAKEDASRYDALRVKPAGDLTAAELQELPVLKERVEKRRREEADRAAKAARRGGAAEPKSVLFVARILLPGTVEGEFKVSDEYTDTGDMPDTPLEAKGTVGAAVVRMLQRHTGIEGADSAFDASDAILVSGGRRMGRHWADAPAFAAERLDKLPQKDGKTEIKYFIAPLAQREQVELWLRDAGYIAGGTPSAVRGRGDRGDRVHPSDDEDVEISALGNEGGREGKGKAKAAKNRRQREETLYDIYICTLAAHRVGAYLKTGQ
jgi:hypothetical protein